MVVCAGHHRVWGLVAGIEQDRNIAEIAREFGTGPENRIDPPCEGTIVVVWSHMPDPQQLLQTCRLFCVQDGPHLSG